MRVPQSRSRPSWVTFEYERVRADILDTGIRIDGRTTTTIRPITTEVGLLPRVHGSALFTRGETQALVADNVGNLQSMNSASTRSTERHANAFCCITTFPRSPSVKPVSVWDLAAEKSVTACWPNVPFRLFSPSMMISRTRSASFPRHLRVTVPPPWLLSAAAACR